MNQKVWVIPDEEWDKPAAKSRPDDGRRPNAPAPNRAGTPSQPAKAQKSPAVSFSLAMLVWGGGYLYLRQYGPGWRFLAAMVFFYSATASFILFRNPVLAFAAESELPSAAIVVGSLVFFMAVLAIWLFNAIDSYYLTARLRQESFSGVDNEIWPLACSLLFPGWGQFVNGQPRKGLFFLLFGMTGLFSAAVLLVAESIWPILKTGHDRFILELYMAAALAVLPVAFLMWIVSAYDSFRSCRAPLISRLRAHYSGKGGRKPGPGYLPRATAILALLLAVSVGMQMFPKGYYLNSLRELRTGMLDRGMEIIPGMVQTAIEFMEGRTFVIEG